jgi:hydrogenase-4 component B
MYLLLAGVCFLVLSGIAAVLTNKKATISSPLGAAGAVMGSAIGAVPAIQALSSGEIQTLHLNWSIPFGSFFVEIDPLSALFLLPILLLSAVSAIYGVPYMRAYKEKNPGAASFFFNMLAAGMILVVIARNGILFLIAWEIMSLASFFLVTFEDEHDHVRRAGWTYIVASHIGTTFLLALFVLLGKESGSLDFDKFTAVKSLPPSATSALFMLALVGFGTKAGLIPLHVWLPEAHPAAPSHVSAVMSGVMIKTGIYGIVRTLMFLPNPPVWWGWLLVGIGAVSGVLGVLLALAQHDLKRLLAYHSVENIGIITLGLGVGVLGLSTGSNVLAVAGFAGAMLHVINHALFKGLLFLGAGSVVHATGTREIDELGGLGKRMPQTAATFLVGSIAICGLPPLNGFISEFMIYYGAFTGTIAEGIKLVVPALLVIGSLALIGGLALACFTKAYGILFLGEPRSGHASKAHEAGFAMRFSMWALATACTAIGLLAPFVVRAMEAVIVQVTGLAQANVAGQLSSLGAILCSIVLSAASFVIFVIIIAYIRHKLLPAAKIEENVTWDCGYLRPEPRMQYTASSFAQPLVDLCRMFLHTRRKSESPDGLFPQQASYSTHTPDSSREYLFKPLFVWIDTALGKLRWLQHGSVQLYVLYIAVTLLILLMWKLG